ncbi:hypothetical protein [Thermoplasma acidophilum]|uniref:Uncharacterized protein n=1 Tax=Thermoplasma acidophilum (strain ATCC 25905 / DSM 1728 / JCM 9062 / NBRC 15155 / AMRC-C165) TaxID=273075 RepID=Q9HI48_THEAC|nr:hypothetical protein [Thermoplasma acidophilum]
MPLASTHAWAIAFCLTECHAHLQEDPGLRRLFRTDVQCQPMLMLYIFINFSSFAYEIEYFFRTAFKKIRKRKMSEYKKVKNFGMTKITELAGISLSPILRHRI